MLTLNYAGNCGRLTNVFPQRLWYALGATHTGYAICTKSGHTGLKLHYGQSYGIMPDEQRSATDRTRPALQLESSQCGGLIVKVYSISVNFRHVHSFLNIVVNFLDFFANIRCTVKVGETMKYGIKSSLRGGEQ